ncbi:MAG: hypothetical protein V1702_02510 [Candidatus Woesearchaeota archaeon]
MAVGKKAVFFTFSALFMLAIVFTWMFFNTSYRVGEESDLVKFKTSNMNEFVAGFDQDVERGVYIAGFRALISAEGYVSNTKVFLNDSVASLGEAMINGTINGVPAPMMTDSTLLAWLTRIKNAAVGVGIIVNASYVGLEINQSSPWLVDFFANITYNVTDFTNTAVFRRSKIASAQISIIGLRDPVYTVYTNGQIIRAINNTLYEGDYASGTPPNLDTTNLKDHINQLMYANSTGPSYLMRLEGNLGDSPMGIESIVRLPDLQGQGLPVYEKSSIDYIYFNTSNPGFCVIKDTFEDWFRLDDAHLAKYQVECKP